MRNLNIFATWEVYKRSRSCYNSISNNCLLIPSTKKNLLKLIKNIDELYNMRCEYKGYNRWTYLDWVDFVKKNAPAKYTEFLEEPTQQQIRRYLKHERKQLFITTLRDKNNNNITLKGGGFVIENKIYDNFTRLEKEAVLLSSEAYKDKFAREKDVNGWIYKQNLSKNRFGVYYNPILKVYMMAIAGTKDLTDINPNLSILFGTFHLNKRFKNMLKAAKRIKKKVKGKEPWIYTGHSLGGTVALYISKKLKSEAIVINPGFSPFIKKQLAIGRRNITIIIRKGDPISNLLLVEPYISRIKHLKILKSISQNPIINHKLRSILLGQGKEELDVGFTGTEDEYREADEINNEILNHDEAFRYLSDNFRLDNLKHFYKICRLSEEARYKLLDNMYYDPDEADYDVDNWSSEDDRDEIFDSENDNVIYMHKEDVEESIPKVSKLKTKEITIHFTPIVNEAIINGFIKKKITVKDEPIYKDLLKNRAVEFIILTDMKTLRFLQDEIINDNYPQIQYESKNKVTTPEPEGIKLTDLTNEEITEIFPQSPRELDENEDIYQLSDNNSEINYESNYESESKSDYESNYEDDLDETIDNNPLNITKLRLKLLLLQNKDAEMTLSDAKELINQFK